MAHRERDRARENESPMISKRSNTASAKGRDALCVPVQKVKDMEEVSDNGRLAEANGLSPFGSSQQAVSPVPASIPSAGGSYQTCRNCGVDRQTCVRRAQVRSGIKGLGLTSIKFRCDDRRPLYRPGQRVAVTWKYYPPDWVWEDGESLETWPATIVAETKKGFLIVVDDVPSGNDLPAREYIKSDSLYCNVAAGKLVPLSEPDRRTCEYCRSAENADGTVTGCWGTNGYNETLVDNCLAQAIETQSAKTEGLGPQDESAVAKPCAQGDRA